MPVGGGGGLFLVYGFNPPPCLGSLPSAAEPELPLSILGVAGGLETALWLAGCPLSALSTSPKGRGHCTCRPPGTRGHFPVTLERGGVASQLYSPDTDKNLD